mmetsp:Transcript_35898/g.83736  ORF Transcript_35898/g.83736 Transcript_35898/m.83736 type:complete len:258 (-) Transcript_35898:1009-1782(-)
MTNQRASMKAAKNLLIFLCAAKLLFLGCAFVPARSQLRLRQINPPHSPLFSDASPAAFSPYPGTCEEEISNDGGAVEAATIGRRGGLSRCAFLTAAASVLTTTAVPFLVRAEEGGTATAAVSAQEAVVTANTVEMKTFVDPVGYFSVRVPKVGGGRRRLRGDRLVVGARVVSFRLFSSRAVACRFVLCRRLLDIFSTCPLNIYFNTFHLLFRFTMLFGDPQRGTFPTPQLDKGGGAPASLLLVTWQRPRLSPLSGFL